MLSFLMRRFVSSIPVVIAVLGLCFLLVRIAPGSPFANTAGPGCFAVRPASRPLTRFERRGERLGHQVRDLVFRRR